MPQVPSQYDRFVATESASRHPWTRVVIVFIGLVAAGSLVFPFDMALATWVQGIGQLPGDFRRILALSELVAHGTGVVVILTVIWCLAPHQRIHLPRVAACGFVAGLVATGLKLVHARLRPLACPPNVDEVAKTWRGWLPNFNEDLGQTYDYALQSFPSAHTATAAGFMIGLMWLYPRGRYLFIALAMLAGLQRVAFAAHWPSDVLFGAAIGVFLGGCFVLPGTVGGYIFNRLEWRLGLGQELRGLAVPQQPLVDQDKKAA